MNKKGSSVDVVLILFMVLIFLYVITFSLFIFQDATCKKSCNQRCGKGADLVELKPLPKTLFDFSCSGDKCICYYDDEIKVRELK